MPPAVYLPKEINPRSDQASRSNDQSTEHVSTMGTESVKYRLWEILPDKWLIFFNELIAKERKEMEREPTDIYETHQQ